MKSTETLKLDSAAVAIEYRQGEKQIFARDLRDTNNEPAFYTKSKRGLDKLWLALKWKADSLDRPLTLSDAMSLCSEMGIKYHYWCMVD